MRWFEAIPMVFCLSSAQAADLANPSDQGLTASYTQTESYPAMATFAACRKAIGEWAKPFAPLNIAAVMVGPIERHLSGKRIAPLHVRIVYDREGGPETRKAELLCTVGPTGTVALMDR